MSRIYTTTYEIIGAGSAKAKPHYDSIEAARKAQWEYVESVGATGFRPSHNGGVRSLFFDGDTMPKGWRKIGSQGRKVEAVPGRAAKIGKHLERELDALPCAPMPTDLAAAFGYSPSEMAIDPERGTIYFPTEMQLSFPTSRIFLRLPRFAGDGFTPDETLLRAIPESELMKAVEDHNAEAKRLREAQGDPA